MRCRPDHPAFGAFRWPVIIASIALWLSVLPAYGTAPSIETANEVAGVRLLQPGKWGAMRTVVANRSDREAVPLVIVGFSDDPLRKFGTHAWLPSWSVREVQTPVLPRAEADVSGVEIVTRLRLPDTDRAGEPASARTPMTRGRFDSALIAAEDDADAQAMVAALRQSAGLKPTIISLRPQALPISAPGYEAIDSVFLCGRDLDLDPIRRDALIGFLESGGRLWVMLDEAGQSWPAALFGDRWDLAILDSVEVTQFVLKGTSGETSQEFDHGVRLVRVCAPTFEATHTVQGIPAALRKFVGRGQLVVTTLSPRGWLDASGTATPALGDLQAFVAPADDPKPLTPTDMKVFDPHIRREIGHEILGRGTVTLILGFALACIIAAAAWAARLGRLELAAPASAVFALASGAVLISLGRAGQSHTSSTSASDQLVLYSGEPGHAEVLARSSIYIRPGDAPTPSTLRSSRGGVVVPDRTGTGSLEQMIWSDPDSCEILGLDLRPGTALNLTTHQSAAPAGTPKATIGVDASGIRGLLDLAGGAERDRPMLVTAAGIERLQTDEHAIFRESKGGSLGEGTLLSEEQIARQRACRDLLAGAWFPSRPTILVWSDLVDIGMTLPAPEKGSSLRAIPVEFEPPEPGAEIAVPSVLLTPEPLRGTIAGRKSGAVYDPIKRSWLGDVHQPMLVVMQFRPPAAFGRIDVLSAALTFDLRAPGCRFDVVVVRDGKLRVVGGGLNPAGRTTLDLSGDNTPEMDADGRILVGIEVHASDALADGPGWSLQRMDLSVRGRAR